MKDKLTDKWSMFGEDAQSKYLKEQSIKASLMCNQLIPMRPDIGHYLEVNGIEIAKSAFPEEYETILKAWYDVHKKLEDVRKVKS
jgi:hypothetical protein